MAKPTLFPDPTCLHLKLLDAPETTITAVKTTTSEEAECPHQPNAPNRFPGRSLDFL